MKGPRYAKGRGAFFSPASSALEEVRVYLGVLLPLVRHVAVLTDSADRANRLAGTALDADVRVDEILAIGVRCVDAVDGASLYTRRILDIDARLANGVRHARSPV